MQILETVDVLRQQGWQYNLEASYIEVYNETLRDLLASGNTRRDGPRLLDASAIKHDPAGEYSQYGTGLIPPRSGLCCSVVRKLARSPHAAGGPTVLAGAERVQVASSADADELIRRATIVRAVESTAMNAVSSRSHSVFMLYISGNHAASSTRVLGALNLVDLAGRCAVISACTRLFVPAACKPAGTNGSSVTRLYTVCPESMHRVAHTSE